MERASTPVVAVPSGDLAVIGPRQRLGVLAMVGGSLLARWDRAVAAPDPPPPDTTRPAAPVSPPPPSGDQTAPGGVPMTTPVRVAPRDDDGAVRLSLPTEEDRAAWRRSGFRLALGILYGQMRGSGEVPDLTLKGVVIRPGIRIDRQWSIYLPLQYAGTSHGGARFAASVEPTWHITPSIALGFGVGYAGLIGLDTYGDGGFGSGPERDLGMLGQSYTFPDVETPVSNCNGVGVTAFARLEAGYVLGPRSRTHVALEALGQRTGCEEQSLVRDNFTGEFFTLRQWWAHTGMSLSWGIEWR